MIKEIAASYWRIRRAWAIESQMLSMRKQAGPTEIDRMTEAFGELAARPKLSLLHRYESRLHIMFQRGLHNLLVLRQAEIPNEPTKSLETRENPKNEHSRFDPLRRSSCFPRRRKPSLTPIRTSPRTKPQTLAPPRFRS